MAIGIFGGAFNPLHTEHMQIARQALDEGLDKIVFVPSNLPPHKTCDVSFDARADMLERALADEPRMEMCPIEGASEGTHYTYRTLPLLIRLYGDVEFIIGGDSMIDLHRWKYPEKIVEMCPIRVFSRADRNAELEQAVRDWTARGARIRVSQYRSDDISSTRIRYGLSLGVTDGVHPSVLPYIREHGLYREYAPMARLLRETVSEQTYAHACRTALYALYLNERCKLGEDSERVFVAGLLHDCAKQWSATPQAADVVPADAVGTPVAHQFAGAYLAQTRWGIEDARILQAIRVHCSADTQMTTLDRIVYCADKLEPARAYDGVQTLRRTVQQDFDRGFCDVLMHAYDYLSSKGADAYPMTRRAVERYCGI